MRNLDLPIFNQVRLHLFFLHPTGAVQAPLSLLLLPQLRDSLASSSTWYLISLTRISIAPKAILLMILQGGSFYA